MNFIRNTIQLFLGKFGFKIQKKLNKEALNGLFLKRFEDSKKFTSKKIEFFLTLENVLNYICSSRIEGDIVECGVFKGANCRFICNYLVEKNNKIKSIYLYDTFEGMPEASADDTNINTKKNYNYYLKNLKKDSSLNNFYRYEDIFNVKNNVISTNYDESKIHFIKGLVENTIPQNIPKKICLVILDTDYYSSTIHELNHLYPLVKKGGVIIIDDYGTWSGVKKAVDEYFKNINDLMFYIDHKTVVFIKN